MQVSELPNDALFTLPSEDNLRLYRKDSSRPWSEAVGVQAIATREGTQWQFCIRPGGVYELPASTEIAAVTFTYPPLNLVAEEVETIVALREGRVVLSLRPLTPPTDPLWNKLKEQLPAPQPTAKTEESDIPF